MDVPWVESPEETDEERPAVETDEDQPAVETLRHLKNPVMFRVDSAHKVSGVCTGSTDPTRKHVVGNYLIRRE